MQRAMLFRRLFLRQYIQIEKKSASRHTLLIEDHKFNESLK